MGYVIIIIIIMIDGVQCSVQQKKQKSSKSKSANRTEQLKQQKQLKTETEKKFPTTFDDRFCCSTGPGILCPCVTLSGPPTTVDGRHWIVWGTTDNQLGWVWISAYVCVSLHMVYYRLNSRTMNRCLLLPTKEEVHVFARVCLSVCLSVSKMKLTQKHVHGFG